MAQVKEVLGGGTFLTRSLDPDDLFTREDLTDEQRLFGQTAAEFMRNEVLPNEASLYAHDWNKTRELLKKAARPRPAAPRNPRRVWRARPGQDQRRLSSASRSRSTRRSADRWARTPRSARCPSSTSAPPIRRRSYLPRLASARVDRRLCADRAPFGLRCALGQDDGPADRRRQALRPQRPEGVDHQRRLCRRLHHLRQGGRREVHRLHRRARAWACRAVPTRRSSGSTGRRRPC